MKSNRINKLVGLGILFCVQFFSSCQKEISEETASDKQVDVYVAGTESNGSTSIAKYWKSGTAINLTDGSKPAKARSIGVSGNDVYVAGWEFNGTYDVATYWKNGKSVYLTDGSRDTYAYAIKVSGNDVYVAGIERSYTCNAPGGIGFISLYWKNGKPLNVSDGTYDANAFRMAVSGNDVYVAGTEYNGFTYVGTYWKNGNPVRLTNPFTAAIANSIAIAGNDVYVVATEYHSNGTSGRLWKNGAEVHLTDDPNSYAECVTVSGEDVYVCGSEAGGAKYWKNGNAVTLDASGSFAYSMAVHGKDVYVLGAKRNGIHSIARYWKNGKAVDLTDGTNNTSVYSIFLSEH